jgi:hypothetical protein
MRFAICNKGDVIEIHYLYARYESILSPNISLPNIWDVCQSLTWNKTVKLMSRDRNLYLTDPASITLGDLGQ